MIITPFEKLIAEAEEIQEFLDRGIDVNDNPEIIKETGDKLSSIISRTGNMLADAKYHLNEMMKDETMKLIEGTLLEAKLSAKVQNSLIDSICKFERLLVDKIEQLNKTAKYQIEWCRSRLSMAKEELNNTRGWNK